MKKTAVLLSVLLVSGCFSNEKKLAEQDDPNKLSRLAQMQTTDPERAARLNVELGLRYFKQGQVARAKTKFNRALKLADNLPEVHYSYAYFLEQVGEVDLARKAYEHSIKLAPHSGVVRNNYGTFLCRQGQYQEALSEFNRAVNDQQYANSSEAMENAGLCALKYNDIAMATNYFERAIRHNPESSDALLELAIIRFHQNKIPQARYWYQQFETVSKHTARSLQLGIELAKIEGDKNKQASLELLLKAQNPGTQRSLSKRS